MVPRLTAIGAYCARHWLGVAMFSAALLTATGLGIGSVGDDSYHLLILQGEKTPARAGDLYTFASGDVSDTAQFIQNGPFPWWTLPQLKIVFVRPLSSALHRMDFALFGRHAIFWHVHAMLWYLAMVAGWAVIARRNLPVATAALATLLFAIDEAHWMPAVWLANRNALIAGVPALFGLAAHLRWRDGWKPGLPLSVIGYGIGMLGGEAWLGIAAYVAAYEMFGARDLPGRRMIALAPAALCAVVYAVAYKLCGYGVYGSGAYLQPLSLHYFQEAPLRMLALAGSLTFASPVDIWAFFPGLRPMLGATGVAGVIFMGWLLRRVWPALDVREQRALRWLIPAIFMSMAPVIAAFPMERLLLAPSLGSSVVIACILRHWWRGAIASKALRYGAVVLVAVNVVIAPLGWPARSWLVGFLGQAAERIYNGAEIDDARVAQQDLYLIAADDPMTLMYPPIVRRLAGRPNPGSWHALSASARDHVLTRIDQKTLELQASGGPLAQGVFFDILRSSEFPMKRGDIVPLRNASIHVMDVVDGKPTRIRLIGDYNLDDERFGFLQWQDFQLRKLKIPPVGQSVLLRYRGK